ncbi:MAG: SCP2 sterol-binding domain-containing protein [Pseudomonadota bacterium]
MSDLESAAEKLREKLEGKDFPGSVKFEVEGAGAIIVDSAGVRIEDGDAELTVKGDLDTFRDMFGGDLDPTQAFMTGRIEVDGDMGAAMQLVQYL